MALPPGIRFLVSNVPRLALPPATAIAFLRLAQYATGIKVPTWISLAVAFLSLPLAFALSVQWLQYKDRRDAVAYGAVLPPVVEHKMPGGVDLLKDMQKDNESRFPGYRVMEWTAKYGPVCNFKVYFENRIITTEPEYIKAVLATDFPGYEKGSELHQQFHSLLGTGVFNSDGDMWKFHRGMTRPFFSREKISHFDIFDSHAEEALKLAKARLSEGYPIDWQDLVSRFTLDCATSFLFGADVHSLTAGIAYPPSSSSHAPEHTQTVHSADVFARSFLQAQIATARRGRYGSMWPIYEFWKDKVEESKEVIDAFIMPLLNAALEKKSKENKTVKSPEEAGETLLEHLVNLTDDPQIIKDETINILLAGRDTTASILTSSVYMLAEHPNVVLRLRREILETVGMRRPTIQDIRDMKYLRAFINETLRLYPPVPANIRYSNKSTVWPSLVPGGQPFYIPAKARIVYSVLVMHRRTDLWGPDAAEFDPDRFLDERLQKYLIPNPFIFMPFNAGPRICLGQQFAYNEASFMLIRLLQQFSKFTLVQHEANPAKVPPPGWAKSRYSNGKDKVRIRSHLTMFVDGGLWIKMEEANDAVQDE